MKTTYYHRYLSTIISFFLLIAPLPLSAITYDIVATLSEIEKNILLNDYNDEYVYLGKKLSNISTIITKIKNLDNDNHSPLIELHTHIENGFLLGHCDAIYNEPYKLDTPKLKNGRVLMSI